MDSEILKTFLASIARHALTALGVYLGFDGEDRTKFIGAGMVMAGLGWSWWQKSGQAQTIALLKKLTATHNKTDAVSTAQALPPATVQSVNSAIVKTLILMFAVVVFLAGHSAFAQTKKPLLTGDIKTDLGLGQPKLITGNAEKDMHTLWDKLISASNADLKYAAALADAANTPASAVRGQCYKAILVLNAQVNGMNVKDANGNPLPQPDPKLFTGVEQAAETIDNLSPQGPLFTACAGMAQLTKTNTLTLINAIVTGAAGLAVMPIIPGL